MLFDFLFFYLIIYIGDFCMSVYGELFRIFFFVFLLFMVRECVWILLFYYSLKWKFSYCFFICILEKRVNFKIEKRDICVIIIK